MFLQQDCIFAEFWAHVASKKPVGLAQRCLFSFGGDMDPAPVDLAYFKVVVMEPLVKDFFRFLVRYVGPKVRKDVAYSITETQGTAVSGLKRI